MGQKWFQKFSSHSEIMQKLKDQNDILKSSCKSESKLSSSFFFLQLPKLHDPETTQTKSKQTRPHTHAFYFHNPTLNTNRNRQQSRKSSKEKETSSKRQQTHQTRSKRFKVHVQKAYYS